MNNSDKIYLLNCGCTINQNIIEIMPSLRHEKGTQNRIQVRALGDTTRQSCNNNLKNCHKKHLVLPSHIQTLPNTEFKLQDCSPDSPLGNRFQDRPHKKRPQIRGKLALAAVSNNPHLWTIQRAIREVSDASRTPKRSSRGIIWLRRGAMQWATANESRRASTVVGRNPN